VTQLASLHPSPATCLTGNSGTRAVASSSGLSVLALTGANTITLGADALAAKVNSVNVGSGGGSIADTNAGTLAVDASALTSGATLALSSGPGAGGFSVTGLAGVLDASAVQNALTVTTAATSAATVTTGSGSNTIAAGAIASGGTLTLIGSGAATVDIGGNLSAGAYTGALAVTATGASAQTIVTGSGSDVITAGPGDTITGGSGSDTFVYTNGANSLYSAYDTITSYSSTDQFNIGHTVTPTNYQSLTGAASGNLYDDIIALLSPANLAAQGADLITLTGAGSDAGSYVVINNAGQAGFNSSSDAVVKLSTGSANVTATSFT
jgi:hypothetical protein